jgi:hypothetical protein
MIISEAPSSLLACIRSSPATVLLFVLLASVNPVFPVRYCSIITDVALEPKSGSIRLLGLLFRPGLIVGDCRGDSTASILLVLTLGGAVCPLGWKRFRKGFSTLLWCSEAELATSGLYSLTWVFWFGTVEWSILSPGSDLEEENIVVGRSVWKNSLKEACLDDTEDEVKRRTSKLESKNSSQ